MILVESLVILDIIIKHRTLFRYTSHMKMQKNAPIFYIMLANILMPIYCHVLYQALSSTTELIEWITISTLINSYEFNDETKTVAPVFHLESVALMMMMTWMGK